MNFERPFEDILVWNWFSEEKGYFFNGTLVSDGRNKILIDPVKLDLEHLAPHGPFDAVYLSNKDHERIAYEIRRKWKVPVGIHEADKLHLKEMPDFVFKDGEVLLCGLKTIHLQQQKSPGECAFYHAGKKLLIAGDALIGHPAGQLNMLPAGKYPDLKKAQAGLRRLFSLDFERILVGDGEHVLENAYRQLEACFERMR